jgi:hypothetical protein
MAALRGHLDGKILKFETINRHHCGNADKFFWKTLKFLVRRGRHHIQHNGIQHNDIHITALSITIVCDILQTIMLNVYLFFLFIDLLLTNLTTTLWPGHSP